MLTEEAHFSAVLEDTPWMLQNNSTAYKTNQTSKMGQKHDIIRSDWLKKVKKVK